MAAHVGLAQGSEVSDPVWETGTPPGQCYASSYPYYSWDPPGGFAPRDQGLPSGPGTETSPSWY